MLLLLLYILHTDSSSYTTHTAYFTVEAPRYSTTIAKATITIDDVSIDLLLLELFQASGTVMILRMRVIYFAILLLLVLLMSVCVIVVVTC